jgi:hypothetical protein
MLGLKSQALLVEKINAMLPASRTNKKRWDYIYFSQIDILVVPLW